MDTVWLKHPTLGPALVSVGEQEKHFRDAGFVGEDEVFPEAKVEAVKEPLKTEVKEPAKVETKADPKIEKK